MSDNKNRDINQDYLDLLSEYARREQEENYPTELIDESFYNLDSEYSSTKTELLKTDTASDFFEDKELIEKSVPVPPPIPKKNIKSKENNPFKRFFKWFKNLSTVKKVIISIVAVILAIIIALVGAGGIFVIHKFSLLGSSFNDSDSNNDVIYEDEDFENIEIDIGSAGFKQSLIDWATIGNDRKMTSKNVINVLLIGADSRNGTNSGNTDVMMLISVNKKTKELKLVSFFRDSYLYIEGKKSSYCTKLNAAYSMGGPETLIRTIENNYKIEIDNYVMVNFESFKSIIDAMGGVTVDVQQYEADYNYKKFKIALPVGDNVTLNGEQALCFVRIRGCDSDGDVSRTRRQRQVIDSILSKVKKASIGDLNKYIDILLPYVDTGYKKTEIISMGIKALTGGWANFERKQLQMPPEDCRTSGSANMWIWVVDYEKAAHDLQMELYGKSNISLTPDRVSIIDVYRGANYTGTNNLGEDNKADDVKITEAPVITTEEQTTTKADVTENIRPTEAVTNPVTDNNSKPTQENAEPVKPVEPTEAPTEPIDPVDPPEENTDENIEPTEEATEEQTEPPEEKYTQAATEASEDNAVF